MISNRLVINFVLLNIYLAAGILAGFALKAYRFMHIDSFVIELDGYSDQCDDVLRQLEPFRNTFTVLAPVKTIGKSLALLDWIKDVGVTVDYPDTLKVVIDSRIPIALVYSQDKKICVDSSGRRFFMDADKIPECIPRFHFTGSAPVNSMKCPSKQLQTAFSVIEFLVKSDNDLQTFREITHKKSHEFYLTRHDGNARIRIRSFDAVDGLERVGHALAFRSLGREEEWDARFPGLLLIRKGNEHG